MRWRVLSVGVLCALMCSGGAMAQSSGNAIYGRGINKAIGNAVWDAAVSGKTTRIGVGDGVTKVVSPGVASPAQAAGGGAARVTDNVNIPVGGGRTVPGSVSGTISKDVIAGMVIGCATGTVVGCALGVGLPLATAYFALSGARVTPSGGLETPEPGCSAGECTRYRFAVGAFYPDSPAASGLTRPLACIAAEQAIAAHASAPTFAIGAKYVRMIGTQCEFNKGWRMEPVPYKVPDSGTWNPSTPQEVKDALYSNDPPPGIVDELSKFGNIIWPVGNVAVTGPSEIKGPKTTETIKSGNTTKTVEKQDVTPITYDGDKVTPGTTRTVETTTTTTTNPDGTTSTETSSTETTKTVEQGSDGTQPGKEDTPKEEEAPTDTPLGDLPKLYERKYPEGMVGVWGDFKSRLSGSSLSQFASGLMPNFNGGSCPEWPVGVNFGNIGFGLSADFGTYDVAPPCWVWDALKAILIVCALLLARGLIFGG